MLAASCAQTRRKMRLNPSADNVGRKKYFTLNVRSRSVKVALTEGAKIQRPLEHLNKARGHIAKFLQRCVDVVFQNFGKTAVAFIDAFTPEPVADFRQLYGFSKNKA